jgi:putative transposase
MKEWQSLAHARRECKRHAATVPKYRKKALYGKLGKRTGEILRELCRYKGMEILEAHAMADRIHRCISVPPKYSIAMAIGYLKGKSAIRIHKELLGRGPKGFANKNFSTRGYCVSTAGLDEKQIREHIQNQEKSEAGEQGHLNFQPPAMPVVFDYLFR